MLTTYKTFLSQKKQLTKNVFLFRFQLVDPKEINFQAGQYLILKIGDKSRLYSIASPPSQKNSFELLVEIVGGGVGSTFLSNLKVGKQAIFQGPAGMFTFKQSPRAKIFLVTGTGIAPVRSMIKSLLNPKHEIRSTKQILNSNHQNSKQFRISNFEFRIFLFWGLHYFSDVYFLDELKQLAIDSEKFQFHICLSREKSLEVIPVEDRKYFALGYVNEVMDKEIEKIENKKFSNNPTFLISQFLNFFDFYLCGSRQVVEALRQYLEQKGVPSSQVFFEKF